MIDEVILVIKNCAVKVLYFIRNIMNMITDLHYKTSKEMQLAKSLVHSNTDSRHIYGHLQTDFRAVHIFLISDNDTQQQEVLG